MGSWAAIGRSTLTGSADVIDSPVVAVDAETSVEDACEVSQSWGGPLSVCCVGLNLVDVGFLAAALEGHRVSGGEGAPEPVAQALAVLRAVRRTFVLSTCAR